MAELLESFGTAMAIGVLFIYRVLVLLFHDFLQPVTILTALPLSLGGAFVALLATGNSFSVPSIIGLLMVLGIVTENSILLVEYALVARREPSLGRPPAILDACHKRARPILMTTVVTGAGMLPLALGLGAEPSFRSPMATAVSGGLIASIVPTRTCASGPRPRWLRHHPIENHVNVFVGRRGIVSFLTNMLRGLPSFQWTTPWCSR